MMVFFAAFILVVAIVLQRLSSQRGLRDIDGGYRPSVRMAEPGSEFTLTLTLTNRSRRVIPFLRYQFQAPPGMEAHLDKGVNITMFGEYNVTGTTWLGPRQRFEKRIPMTASARGRYIFREMAVSGGDFLGLNEHTERFHMFHEVVIPPKEAPGQEVDAFFGGFMGDVSVSRFIFEDPVLTLGYREYTGREPLKMISWAQSARAGSLMVKKYDYTLEPSVCVMLNVECPDGTPAEELERCFSLTRSVCGRLEDKGIKYEFRTNVLVSGGMDTWYTISEGLGPRHFGGILEGLGRATYEAAFSCRQMVEQAARSPGAGHGLIFITPGDDPAPERDARWLTQLLGGALCTVRPGRCGS